MVSFLEFNYLLFTILWQGQGRLPPAHRAQGRREDLEQTKDQEPGRGGQNQEGDTEPQALPSSAHHQALPGVVSKTFLLLFYQHQLVFTFYFVL